MFNINIEKNNILPKITMIYVRNDDRKRQGPIFKKIVRTYCHNMIILNLPKQSPCRVGLVVSVVVSVSASYPGPGFLSSATWPSLPMRHCNGLNQLNQLNQT